MQNWQSKLQIQHLDKLAPLFFLLILIWLCWRLASLIWWVVAPPQAPVIQSVVLGSQQPAMPNIIRFSLFEEQGKDPQTQQVQADVPLKLEGIMLASPRYLSSAVIRSNNQADRYRIGTTVTGTQYTLAEVYWDHVIIRDANGQNRALKFGQETTTALPPAQSDSSAPSSTATNADGSNSQANPNPTQNSTGNAINQAIDQLQKDPQQYLSQMGVNAGQNGFEVTERTPPALRARLGLKSGDRIVSVNGQSITAGMNEAQLLEQVKKTGQAKIEIQRGDQVMTIQQSF